jgi:aspartate/tyrosine/aromatic aminotransferase
VSVLGGIWVIPLRAYCGGGRIYFNRFTHSGLCLIGERTGNLTVVTRTPQQAQHVLSQLEILQRSEISNPPAYGARIVDLVLNDKQLYAEWRDNLGTMAGRIIEMRRRLFEKLQQLQTPGTWNHIVDQIGMFSFTGLSRKFVHDSAERLCTSVEFFSHIVFRVFCSSPSQGPQGEVSYLHD